MPQARLEEFCRYSHRPLQIDELPTRAELLQYERRFVELYQQVCLCVCVCVCVAASDPDHRWSSQVAAKLDETRKYYDTYNTLREKCSLLDKQAGPEYILVVFVCRAFA